MCKKKSIRIFFLQQRSFSSFGGVAVVVVIIRLKCRHFIILSHFSPLCICFRFVFLLATEDVHFFAQCFNIHQTKFPSLSAIQYSSPFVQPFHSMLASMFRVSLVWSKKRSTSYDFESFVMPVSSFNFFICIGR